MYSLLNWCDPNPESYFNILATVPDDDMFAELQEECEQVCIGLIHKTVNIRENISNNFNYSTCQECVRHI